MTGFVRKIKNPHNHLSFPPVTLSLSKGIHVNNKGATMTLSQIRRLVDSLMLKYADEVEVYRLQPAAERFCDDMANAVTGKKRGRRRSIDEWAEIFFKRVRERGLRLQGLAHLNGYLERCLEFRILPRASELLRELLPSAARRGLIPRAVEKPVRF